MIKTLQQFLGRDNKRSVNAAYRMGVSRLIDVRTGVKRGRVAAKA
ncbi:hypothetical protein N8Z34_02155 [Oceanospirillaceae bacterium]|nr:hypothetical protein [Oceanospirillaceae bacterium]